MAHCTLADFPKLEDVFKLMDLAPLSIKKYQTNINIIRNGMKLGDGDRLYWINRSATVSNWIHKNKQYSVASKKSMFITLYSVSKTMMTISKCVYRRTLNFYKSEMEKMRDINNEEMDKNTVYDENFLSMKELQDICIDLPDETQKQALEKCVLALYVFLPPLRLDYAFMRIFNRPVSVSKVNHIIFNTQYLQFVLHEYKNSDKMGVFKSERILPSSPLYKFVAEYMKYNTEEEWFLVNKDGKPLSRTQLSYMVSAVIERETGLKINVRRLRRIYETELIQSPEYSKMTLSEKKEKHAQLLHSFNTAQQYNIVNSDNEIII